MNAVSGGIVFAAVVSLLAGLLVDPRGLALFSALACVLLLGWAGPWLQVRRLSGRLVFSRERATEGEEILLELTLQNRGWWAVYGVRVEGLGELAPGLWNVPRGSQSVHRWKVTVPRRGVYPRGEPTLRCSFPFGFWEARCPLALSRPLLVWPAIFAVGDVPECAGGEGAEGPLMSTRTGTSGDLVGVRPYRRGDSLRKIHWAQSARHDRWIVCEQQATRRPRVVVLLDLDPRAYTPGAREWAIRTALSLVVHWGGQGVEMTALWAEGPQGLGRGQGARLDGLRDALAQLGETGEGGESLLCRAQPALVHATLVLCLTGVHRGDCADPRVTVIPIGEGPPRAALQALSGVREYDDAA